MENWLVQQLRFSAFVPGATPQLLDDVWGLISPGQPDSDESRPREGFRRIAASDEDGALLEVVMTPGRFDVLRSPAAAAEILPVVHLGPAIPRVNSFVAQIFAVLSAINLDIQRIAFGLVLVRPVPSREVAYAALQGLLPVQLNPETSREFLFQINHPEMISVGQGTLELNRLGKWSAMRTMRFALQLAATSGGAPVSTQTELAAGEHFVRCEVDNSTAADRIEALPRDNILPIFQHLVDMAYTTSMGEQRAAQ